MRIGWGALCALLLITGVSAGATDWPHWRGPDRNGTTPEISGYEAGAWPLAKPIWTASAGGSGETSPVVAGGRLYTLSYKDGKDRVLCLNAATGAKVWEQSYASRARGRFATGDEGLYAEGPLSTPEYDGETGYLYTLGCDGDLRCWDTRKDGAPVWGVNLYDRFTVERRPFTGVGLRDYGYTSAPLVYGEWVIVEAGAKEGNLLAFDKRTGGSPAGTPAWRSQNSDPAGHTGGMTPLKVGGIPCVAVITVYRLLVARLDRGHEGETLAAYDYKTRLASNLVSPAIENNLALLTSHYGPGDQLVEITPTGIVRRGDGLHSEVGVPVFRDGRLYGGSGALECWQVSGGKGTRLWQGGNLGVEGVVALTRDGRVIAQGSGRIALYSRDGKLLSEITGVQTGWPSFAVADGRLYVKDRAGMLICYALRKAR